MDSSPQRDRVLQVCDRQRSSLTRLLKNGGPGASGCSVSLAAFAPPVMPACHCQAHFHTGQVMCVHVATSRYPAGLLAAAAVAVPMVAAD